MDSSTDKDNVNIIKVFVVDDILSIRLLLTQIINQEPDMKVIGAAENPIIAGDMLRELKPDVMTLDMEMPEMDGLTFLKKIMSLKPLPVVMISTRTAKGSADAIKALELGAVEVIGKPSQKTADIKLYSEVITNAIRSAAAAKIGSHRPIISSQPPKKGNESIDIESVIPLPTRTPNGRDPLILVGASTGGTEAIKQLLSGLHDNLPPILITQHMPVGFTAAFAKRLDDLSPLNVVEAQERMQLQDGYAYVASGGHHLLVKHLNGNYYCQLSDLPPVSRHKPSVNCLFQSGIIAAGSNITAILLTGMGDDGAQGMLNIKNTGGHTLVQDEASSVVYGMPRKAQEMGAACKQANPVKLAKYICERYE